MCATDSAAAPTPAANLAAPAPEMPQAVVSLAGVNTFQPPDVVASCLDAMGDQGGFVNVRLAGLASGRLHVRKSAGNYETAPAGDYQYPPFTHPILESLRQAGVEPALAVQIREGAVSGFVTAAHQGRGLPDATAMRKILQDNATLLNWIGLDKFRFPNIDNQLANGVLRLRLNDFAFSSAASSMARTASASTTRRSPSTPVPMFTSRASPTRSSRSNAVPRAC